LVWSVIGGQWSVVGERLIGSVTVGVLCVMDGPIRDHRPPTTDHRPPITAVKGCA